MEKKYTNKFGFVAIEMDEKDYNKIIDAKENDIDKEFNRLCIRKYVKAMNGGPKDVLIYNIGIIKKSVDK
ncbi:MAG: hypothetical protein IJ593_12095 [Lachnospiraceae bacterium]|nr:hypothetical protein [Lachnospiraceae bacterium]